MIWVKKGNKAVKGRKVGKVFLDDSNQKIAGGRELTEADTKLEFIMPETPLSKLESRVNALELAVATTTGS